MCEDLLNEQDTMLTKCGPESATPYADWANSGFRSGRPAYATTRRFS